MRKKYLFIRILEACNANCFMCDYAMSKDAYRFSTVELAEILPQAKSLGVEFIRFTGGEPLMHKDILELVRMCSVAGMGVSLITNGATLKQKSENLANCGLTQVIGSIDGLEDSHDDIRGASGLFRSCIEGLIAAKSCGIHTRVNSVVGPHNYREMPSLQTALSQVGVEQWELSAIKLGRPIVYDDPNDVIQVCSPIYEADPSRLVIPMGTKFFGDTAQEQELFFKSSILPRARAPKCNLIGDVIYLDAKNGTGFGCSLLPHRHVTESLGGATLRQGGRWQLDVPAWARHVMHFAAVGPNVCTSCSTTAAGYSNRAGKDAVLEDWAF